MENMVNFNSLFQGIYRNKKVVITGHTGFKGSWLSLWLKLLNAKVYGFSLPPPTKPNHFDLLKLDIFSNINDIRNYKELENFMLSVQPDIVFHLAAQPIVRKSYDAPLETYSTNVTGTLNLLDICRKINSIKAVIVVTSDKCYENKEWIWGYRENDSLGGYDPYSSSKACVEILSASFRNSFFNIMDYGKKHNLLLATVRAGNVIGGGDWAIDRLVPDIVRAASKNKKAPVREPYATRPWQHLLEPLSGYLTLGSKLLQGKTEFAEAWNFGPELNSNLTVNEIIEISKKYWDKINIDIQINPDNVHEAHLLMLDCSKSAKLLKWMPVWDIEHTVFYTVNWYKKYYEENIIDTQQNIINYINDAINKGLSWTK